MKVILFLLYLIVSPVLFAADLLPSWNDTAPKKAIVAFVERVTKPGSADFVPAPERIATFDNDGTLWAEQPIYFQLDLSVEPLKLGEPLVA
jgi:acyl carrier protein phosphodiesterase